MPTITHDHQSLMIDGRRIWLTSGMIDYFRVPATAWQDRINMAADMGLNTVLVRCPWAVHEPRKGEFCFEGNADVERFVSMIADHDLKCIMRVGPYVGHDLDLGGMPSWLLAEPGLKLRQKNQAFLEATSRMIGRLLRVLEPYSGSKGGPIVLVQVEHEWYCGHQKAADDYLLELSRFIREHGFDVPQINTNNLWQIREETIDTWSGRDQMLMHLRQLRSIHPTKPLIVGDFWTGEVDCWAYDRPTPPTPSQLMHQLGQAVAAGAQFNLSPFHGGTNFAFSGGRIAGYIDRYVTASADGQAPLSEAGLPSASYWLLRRLCMFVSSFSKIFSSIDLGFISAVQALEPPVDAKKTRPGGSPVVHLNGSQGGVVMVFGNPDKHHQSTYILLASGHRLPVELDDQPLAWCLLNVHLSGCSRLDWTNLNAFAMVGRRILVLFGAPGQPGLISINYSLLELEVPRRQAPVVEIHEEITLVICNSASIDATYVRNGEVHVGVKGFSPDGEPVPAEGFRYRYIVNQDGEIVRKANGMTPTRPAPIKPHAWQAAPINEYIDGTAPRYATIDGPSTQEQCSAGSGYGLIRISLPKGTGKKTKILSPLLGDRVHFYVDGELKALIGQAPGARDQPFDLTLSPGKTDIVCLIDNLGRYAGGNDMLEGKGVVSHLYEVASFKLAAPEIVENAPIRPFDTQSYIEGMAENSATCGHDLCWNFTHRRKSDLILDITGPASQAVILINDVPIAFYAGQTGRPKFQLVLNDDIIKRGPNQLRLATIQWPEETDLAPAVTMYEIKSVLTESATWSFAKWECPKEREFATLSRAAMKALSGRPAWFKATFVPKSSDVPLWLELPGLSKGQIFINGENLCRYFVATHTGKAVGPQKRYYLPASWLKPDEENELLIFDEHGRDPSRVRVVAADSAF